MWWHGSLNRHSDILSASGMFVVGGSRIMGTSDIEGNVIGDNQSASGVRLLIQLIRGVGGAWEPPVVVGQRRDDWLVLVGSHVFE